MHLSRVCRKGPVMIKARLALPRYKALKQLATEDELLTRQILEEVWEERMMIAEERLTEEPLHLEDVTGSSTSSGSGLLSML